MLPEDPFEIQLPVFGRPLATADAARWDDNAHFHLSGLRAEEILFDPVLGN